MQIVYINGHQQSTRTCIDEIRKQIVIDDELREVPIMGISKREAIQEVQERKAHLLLPLDEKGMKLLLQESFDICRGYRVMPEGGNKDYILVRARGNQLPEHPKETPYSARRTLFSLSPDALKELLTPQRDEFEKARLLAAEEADQRGRIGNYIFRDLGKIRIGRKKEVHMLELRLGEYARDAILEHFQEKVGHEQITCHGTYRLPYCTERIEY